jgi:hypothetical protein
MKKPAASEMECGYETVDSGKQPDAAAPATPAGTHPDTAVPRAKAKAKNSQKKNKSKTEGSQPVTKGHEGHESNEEYEGEEKRQRHKQRDNLQKKQDSSFEKASWQPTGTKSFFERPNGSWRDAATLAAKDDGGPEGEEEMLSKIQRSTLVMDKWYKLPQIQKVEQDAGQRPSATGAEKYVS